MMQTSDFAFRVKNDYFQYSACSEISKIPVLAFWFAYESLAWLIMENDDACIRVSASIFGNSEWT